MSRLFFIILLVITSSCMEKWNEEEETEVKRLANRYEELLNRQMDYRLFRMSSTVKSMGNRPLDIEVIDEHNHVHDVILNQPDSIEQLEELKYWNTIEDYKKAELLGLENESLQNYSMVKSYIANRILEEYGYKIGGHHLHFDTPVLRLWRSKKDPDLFFTAVSGDSDQPSIWVYRKDGAIYQMNQFLTIQRIELEWELLFEKRISWSYEIDEDY